MAALFRTWSQAGLVDDRTTALDLEGDGGTGDDGCLREYDPTLIGLMRGSVFLIWGLDAARGPDLLGGCCTWTELTGRRMTMSDGLSRDQLMGVMH